MPAAPLILQYDIADDRPRLEPGRVVLFPPPLEWQLTWLAIATSAAAVTSVLGGSVALQQLFARQSAGPLLAAIGAAVFFSGGAWTVWLVRQIFRRWQFGRCPIVIESADEYLTVDAPALWDSLQLIPQKDVVLIDIGCSGFFRRHRLYRLEVYIASRSNVRVRFRTDDLESIGRLQRHLPGLFNR